MNGNRHRYAPLMGTLILLAGQAAVAGEFQLAVRAGKTWIDIDGDRLSSRHGVNDSLINGALTASYRWERGGYIEAGIGGSGTLDILGIEDLDHHWIGGGWQFDLEDHWKLTPKAGLTYSELTSSEENLFDGEPVDEFTDIVPFVEIALEHRFGQHVGLSGYLRHTFEDWGKTHDLGIMFSYTF